MQHALGFDRAHAKPLRTRGDLHLYRMELGDGSASVLVVAAADRHETRERIHRLRHEHSLRDLLDPAWAACPRSLLQEGGETLLVLEDPRAELLAGLIGPRWDVGTFLRVAAGIVDAVGRAHAGGLVHRDIGPDNILVDPASGRAWLTGFGIASRLAPGCARPHSRSANGESPTSTVPDEAGPVAQIADARSDLYALGVTFHRMLAGAWVDSAEEPTASASGREAPALPPPPARDQSVPDMVSHVVMKLLAATVEARYQTAAEVAVELQRCQDQRTTAPGQNWYDVLRTLSDGAPADASGRVASGGAGDDGPGLACLLEAAQAVSAEIDFEKLIEKIMAIVLQHAAATRGVLLLPSAESYVIHAEADLDREGMRLQLRHAQVTAADMPESILRDVVRTRDIVVLEDTACPNPYSTDPYMASGPCRSMLCLPLLRQGRLIGVLHLENAVAADAFAPVRVAVLRFLASQAAVAIENARLYADLRRENAERGRSEEALRQSEERFALAVQAAGDGHTDWMAPTDQMYVSPRLLEMLGLPPTMRFAGRADFLAHVDYHPDDRERVLRTLDNFYAGNAGRLEHETRIRRGGETRWLKVTTLCSRDAAGRVLRSNSAVTDITAQRLAQESLRESEERFALAAAGANEGIFDWDLQTDQVYLSQRAQELLGVDVGETWRGRREWSRSLRVPFEDARAVHRSIKALVAGEVPASDLEFRVACPGGGQRWFRKRAIALRDETGRAYRIVGSLGDITDRKQAQDELLRMERRLRQAQRLEAVGTLASGVAHDFNNILGAVLGYGARALGAAPVGSPIASDLERILAAGERGRALVDRIMAFSDNCAGEPTAVDVQKVVVEVIELLTGKLPEPVKVQLELRAAHPAVMGDPTQIHRVLMNLATNAIQAMPLGGELKVTLDVLRVAQPRLATVGGLDAREYVVLTVADDGHGMPADVVERIFDPFFTTKDVKSGTGLGLSLVHGIVTNMEGAIDVVSAPRMGSAFTVYLPRSGAAEDPAGTVIPSVPRGSGQQVLLVDDEEPLLILAVETLEELGYQTRGFTSAGAALQAFRDNPDRFNAVITDERMPGMTGSALVGAIRAIRHDVPIMLMSGFVGGGLAVRARAFGVNDVLKKPLSRHDLAASLARVLVRQSEAR